MSCQSCYLSWLATQNGMSGWSEYLGYLRLQPQHTGGIAWIQWDGWICLKIWYPKSNGFKNSWSSFSPGKLPETGFFLRCPMKVGTLQCCWWYIPLITSHQWYPIDIPLYHIPFWLVKNIPLWCLLSPMSSLNNFRCALPREGFWKAEVRHVVLHLNKARADRRNPRNPGFLGHPNRLVDDEKRFEG